MNITLLFIILIVLLRIIFPGYSLFYVDLSTIQNADRGLFSRGFVKSGTFLFTGIEDYKVTAYASMVNHCSKKPNSKLVRSNDSVYNIYAIGDIQPNQELLIDYNYTPDFIDKPSPEWTC